MPSALRERLAARRAQERWEEALRTPPRTGYRPGRPNAERTLAPAGDGFGALVRSHRLRRGWSMTKLGGLACVGHAGIHRYETGERAPGREAAERIAAALGLDGDETAALLIVAGFLPPGYTAVKTPA